MLPIITSLFSLSLYNCMDKKKMSNFKVIHRLTVNCKKEVKSTNTLVSKFISISIIAAILGRYL